MIAGLHAEDPLNAGLAMTAHIPYPSDLHVLSPERSAGEFDKLDGRVPYLEVGAL
jgi:hypothetical protein